MAPQRTEDGYILVDWYTNNDPENPQNWPKYARVSVTVLMCAYSWVVYTASSTVAPCVAGIIQDFGIDSEDASLPLVSFVLAVRYLDCIQTVTAYQLRRTLRRDECHILSIRESSHVTRKGMVHFQSSLAHQRWSPERTNYRD